MPPASPEPILRPFRPDDYPKLLELHRAVDPSFALGAAELRQQDESRRGEPQARLVLEREGRLLAAAGYSVKKASAAHYRLELLVLPNLAAFEEVAQRLYRAVREQLAPLRPQALSALVREDQGPLVAFLRGLAFEEFERQSLSRLDLTTFDAAPFLSGSGQPGDGGVRFVTRADLADLPEETGLRRLYRLIVELLVDVPHGEDLDIWPFEVWRERSQTPARRAESCFLALAGDEWVGLTELLLSDQPTHLRTGLTGVRRGWRGRGIATALKLMALDYAKRQGATEVTTSNHQTNRAMWAINERLGFRQDPAWITFRRDLIPPQEPS